MNQIQCVSDVSVSRANFKCVTNLTSINGKQGCSPSCPACTENLHQDALVKFKTRVVDNTNLRREVFKRLANLRLDKNAANESIEAADCRNEGYELEGKIGKGAYSVVKRARIKTAKIQENAELRRFVEKTGQDKIAVKIILKENGGNAFSKRFIEGECKALYRTKGHQNVIEVLDTFETASHLYIITELCIGGDLIDYVTRHNGGSGGVDDDRARFLFTQLLDGLQHCHSMGVAHRDLKCDNILISADETTLKITDFGFACNMSNRRFMTETPCGSHSYAAPEVLFKERYDPIQADIWSCGVILYCMTNGNVPFYKVKMSQIKEVMKMQRVLFDRKCSPEVKHLLRRILQFDPSKRPKLCNIRTDPWVQGVKLKGGERLFRETTLRQSAMTRILPEPFRVCNPSPDQQRLAHSSVNFGNSSLPSIIQLKSRQPNKERDICLKTNFYKRRLTKRNSRKCETPPMVTLLERLIDGNAMGIPHSNGDGDALEKSDRVTSRATSSAIEEDQPESTETVKANNERKDKKEEPKLPERYTRLSNEMCSYYNISNGPKHCPEEHQQSTPEIAIRQAAEGQNAAGNSLKNTQESTQSEQNVFAFGPVSKNGLIYSNAAQKQPSDVTEHMMPDYSPHSHARSGYVTNNTATSRITGASLKETANRLVDNNTCQCDQNIPQPSEDSGAAETGRINHKIDPGARARKTGEDRPDSMCNHAEMLFSMSDDVDYVDREEIQENRENEAGRFPLNVINAVAVSNTIAPNEINNSMATPAPSCASCDTEMTSPRRRYLHGGTRLPVFAAVDAARPASPLSSSAKTVTSAENVKIASPGISRAPSAKLVALSGVRIDTGSLVQASLQVKRLDDMNQSEASYSAAMVTKTKRRANHRNQSLQVLTRDLYQPSKQAIPLQMTSLDMEGTGRVICEPPIVRKWNTPAPSPKTLHNRGTGGRTAPVKAMIHCNKFHTTVTIEAKLLSDREQTTSGGAPPSDCHCRTAKENLNKVNSVTTVANRLTRTPTLMERVSRALDQTRCSERVPKIRNLQFESTATNRKKEESRK